MSAANLLLAMVQVVAAAEAPPPRPTPIAPASWMKAGDYPKADIAAGKEGVLAYELSVDSAGRPTGCRVIGSSGSKSLDRAACPLLRARARFEPARNAGGETVASSYRGQLAWRLPRGPTAETTLTVLRADLAPDGLLVRCELEEVVGQDRRDAALFATCGEPVPRPAGPAMRPHAAGYGSLRLVSTFAPLEAPPPGGDRSRWGERLSYRAYEFALRADGSALRCTMTADEGIDPGDRGLCAAEEPNLPRDPVVRNAPAAKTIRIEEGLYGVRR